MNKALKIQMIEQLIIIIISSCFAFSAFADVAYNIDEKENYIATRVTGEITPSDLNKFKQIDSYISNFKGTRKPFYVELNTGGGDMNTAIEIGKILRKNNAVAVLRFSETDGPDKCYSACVFILAGAPFRSVSGLVGIHRPYMANDKTTSPDEQKLIQQKTEIWAKSYLNEMNIPQVLYDDLMRVPPEKNRILTELELSKYGLNENDPYFNDAMVASEAKKLGITSVDVLKRKARADKICTQYSDIKKLGDCYIKITKKGKTSYP
jgi:hypothetical protein